MISVFDLEMGLIPWYAQNIMVLLDNDEKQVVVRVRGNRSWVYDFVLALSSYSECCEHPPCAYVLDSFMFCPNKCTTG